MIVPATSTIDLERGGPVAVTFDPKTGKLDLKAADDDALREFADALEENPDALVDFMWNALNRARAH